MKSLDCNQIKIFINLEIIREEDKYIKIILIFFKILKKLQPLGTITASMLNFYYIVYDMI